MARQRFNRKSKPPVRKNTRQAPSHTGERVKPNDHILINEFLFRRGESSLAAEIITFFSDHEGARLRSLDLAIALGYTESKQLPGFWYVLHKLQEEGAVDKDSNRCYGLSLIEASTYEDHLVHVKPFPIPGKEHYKVSKTYTGRISTHPNGYGFVDVEGFDDDIFIKAGDLNSSIHGDEVEVLVSKVPDTYTSKSTPHQRCEGAVKTVISRAVTTIIGTLTKANRKFVLKPDNRKILPEIIVSIKNSLKAIDGQKVLVGDLDFSKEGVIQAKVLEVLGTAGDSAVEVSAIARSRGIDETFDPKLLDFAASIKEGITAEDLKDRLDIRDKTVFTIDPVDAKDFDDALSIEALVVADMPIHSYNDPEISLKNAQRFLKEAGADAVKLEGGATIQPQIEKLMTTGISVMGHVGMLPQSIGDGKYRVYGKDPDEAKTILEDVKLLDRLGVFAIVLECVPAKLAAEITKAVRCPTIGIGAGPETDGQVLVFQDILGIRSRVSPRFVRHYAGLEEIMKKAAGDYCRDVQNKRFPSKKESFS